MWIVESENKRERMTFLVHIIVLFLIFFNENQYCNSFQTVFRVQTFSQIRSKVDLKSDRSVTLLKSVNHNDNSLTKSSVLSGIAKKLLFLSLFSTVANVNLQGITESSLLSIQPVQAEFRAAQRSTFFRVVPRFVAGRDYYRTELKTAVEKQQWDAIGKFFELYPSKINKNDPNQIDAYDSYVNKNILRPLKLLTSSSAEKGTSPKQQLLFAKEQEFEQAMALLEGSVKDRKGDGLFAGTIKAPTGKERIEQV